MLKSISWQMLVMLVACVAVSVADETKPAAEPKDNAEQDALKKEDEGGKGSFLDRLKKELFEEIEDGSKKPQKKPEDDKLERAAKGMRNAGEKLGGDETGKDTRKIQEQVIRDLDDLINQLQNPPPSQNSGGGGGGASQQKMSRSQMQKMGSSSAQAGKAQPLPSGGQAKQGGEQKQTGSAQEKKIAEGSEERSDSEKKASEEAARKKKLEMDVWGHLPPHLRDQMMNTYGEKMLPRYQQMVKQFYEALSEQGDTGPRR